MSLILPKEKLLNDIVRIHLRDDTGVKALSCLLTDLDKMVNGFWDEETDENGDNPEPYEIPPSIAGYSIDYGERYFSINISFFRNPDKIKEDWNSIIWTLARSGVKIDHLGAGCQYLAETSNKCWSWGFLRGSHCRFTGFPEGTKDIYGLDMNNRDDRNLLIKWSWYMLSNPEDRFNGDYYEWTGSLGHDGHN